MHYYTGTGLLRSCESCKFLFENYGKFPKGLEEISGNYPLEISQLTTRAAVGTRVINYQVGTCESEFFVQIESRIESAAKIRIQIES